MTLPLLLINPPIVKPSEPPAGIARLSGALSAYGVHHHILDANIEGIYYLLRNSFAPADTWTRRASRNLSRNLDALKDRGLYRNADRYKRAVLDVNRILEMAAAYTGAGAQVSLADYRHPDLSPTKSADLIYAAGHPEENPFYPYFSMRLKGLIEKEGIRTVGFSLNYLSQTLTAFAMIGFLKCEYPSTAVVAGGGLITSWMRNPVWKNPFGGLIDRCVAGPGETPLLEILGKKPLKNAHYRPSYELLPVKDYFSPGFVLPYSASTGCWWGKCAFCPEKAEGNRYAPTHPDVVMDDLHFLIEQYHPALVHLTDNAISPAMLNKIAAAPLNAPWYGFTRITPHLADPEFCRTLKRSGCVMLKLGLESASREVLDSMNKGCNITTVSKVLQALKEADIATYVYLLFGTPAETLDDARMTLDFIARHADYIDFLNLAIFNLPVNSPEAKGFATVDFYEGDLSLYRDFRHPEAWDRRQVRNFLDKEFKRHPAIRSILRNHPPFFTSNHALFLAMEHCKKVQNR